MQNITRQEYEALCDEVWHHNRLYFQEMRPEISDEAFDMLVKRLEAIEDVHPEWISSTSPTQRIGEKPIEGFQDVTHAQAMLSLEKAFTLEELTAYHERTLKLLEVEEITYCGELKMDGLAISVTYEKGHFVRAVTRGDGKVGSDVTANLKTVPSLPLRLDPKKVPALFEVRGEVFLPKQAFDKMNEERQKQDLPLWANARNAAAGSLKLLDPKEVAKRHELSVVFYGIATFDQTLPKSQYALYSYFSELGLPTILAILKNRALAIAKLHTPEEMIAYSELVAKKRDELPFAIDGLVFKVDDLSAYDRLGTTGKHPRGAIAFKFSAEQAWTLLREITVQVGRTGVITPVAELEPTFLAGSTISRATLHNFEELERKDIREGDYVLIEKGGDVIPKVVVVDHAKRAATSIPFAIPTHCPVCHTVLVKDPDEVALRCPNSDGCPEQVTRRLIHFASKSGLEIEHLGEKVMQQLVKKGFVTRFSDIFALRAEELSQLDGFKEKSVSNLLASIEKAKTTTLAKLIMALGVRYVGSETATLLAAKAKTVKALVEMTEEDFLATQGVGEKMAASLVSYFQSEKNRKELERLQEFGLHFEEETKVFDTNHPFYDKTIVLTGTLESMPRHVAIDKIRAFGGRSADTVSKKVDFLVVGGEPGSKVEKAKKLNIPILDEAAFIKILESP